MTILEFCGQIDPLAKRNALILRQFKDVLVRQNAARTAMAAVPRTIFGHQSSALSQQQPFQGTDIGSQPRISSLQPLPSAMLPSADSAEAAFVNQGLSSTFAPSPLIRPNCEGCLSGLLDANVPHCPSQDVEHISPDEGIGIDVLWQ